MQDPGIFFGLGQKGMRRRLESLSSRALAIFSIGLIVLLGLAWLISTTG